MSDPVASTIVKSVAHIQKKEYQQAVSLINTLVPLSDKPQQSHAGIMNQLDSLVTHVLCSDQLPLIVRAVVILMNVSKDEKHVHRIGQLTIHHIVQQVIKKQVEPQTVEYSVMLLRNLMRSDENRLLFASNQQLMIDLVDSLVQYESKNKAAKNSVASHRNITMNLLGCIGLLASNEMVAEQIVKVNVDTLLPTLMNILKDYASNANAAEVESLIVSTLQCLQYLAYYCDENATRMHRLGLEKVLVAHYVTRGGNVGKVSSTLNLILSQNEDNVQDLENESSGDGADDHGAGGGEDSLSILIEQLRNDEDEDAQVRAISNLWSLAAKQSNRQVLRDRSVAQELLRILQTSSFVENIQEAVGCLATMSQDAITATLVARQNGVAIMARLISVKDEYQIQLYAISIFGFMCILTDEALDDVRRYNLLERLKQAMKSSLEKQRELRDRKSVV